MHTMMTRLLLFAGLVALTTTVTAQEITLDSTPRRYLEIQVSGANGVWKVRPFRMVTRSGAVLDGASEKDFASRPERWPRTGLPKRYRVDAWRKAMVQYTGATAPEGGRFFFYAVDPGIPRADDGVVNEVDKRRRLYWIALSSFTPVAYPQTWIDIFEGYVEGKSGEERRLAVKEWEAAHRDIIRNDSQSDDGLSPEEQNEFAQFYQAQFVYIRDRNPTQAAIYDELVSFHRERGNLDAELSVYMSALRCDVPSPDRERFALEIGRIFVNRLGLLTEAREYLGIASHYSEARRLDAHCLVELGRLNDAKAVVEGWIADLSGATDESEESEGPEVPEEPDDDAASSLAFAVETSTEEDTGRAWLAMAEIEFRLRNFGSANDALRKIDSSTDSYAKGRLIYAAMLLSRGANDDLVKAREAIEGLPLWADATDLLGQGDSAVWPLDPAMAKMLVIYVQLDNRFHEPPPENPINPPDDVLEMLNAAKILDPLSSEAYLAEGRLLQRLGHFRRALDTYEAGLRVNPRSAMLNYKIAELQFRSGGRGAARTRLSICMSIDPQFYPALVMLGEIAQSEIDETRNELALRAAAGEDVDVAGVLVPRMKEASAYLSSALAIRSDLHDVKLMLATLYTRLGDLSRFTVSDTEDAEEVRKAYLSRSRNLALELVERAREFAEDADNRPKRPSLRDVAQAPKLEAYNVLAYAMYALGDIKGAQAVLEEHVTVARDTKFFVTSRARTEYAKSGDVAWAENWLRKIRANERKYFEVLEFDEDSKDGYFGEWVIPIVLKPDVSFSKNTRIKNGQLTLAVEQREGGVVSRIETERNNATLSEYEAFIPKLGDIDARRGIHFTKYSRKEGASNEPKVSLMLGVDENLRVFWEVRTYSTNKDTPEKLEASGFIEPEKYGGLPLSPNGSLTIALRRQLASDSSKVEFVAVINGYENVIPIENPKELTRKDFSTKSVLLQCGAFLVVPEGVKAEYSIERVRFVYDSGLGGKKR